MTTQNTRQRGRNCIDCGRDMRPMKANPADWPDTVIHQGRGLCSTHYKKRSDSGTLKTTPPLQKPHSATPFEVDPLKGDHIERLQRAQIDFHRGWRRRNGLDVTAPIDLRQIAMAAA